jgi:hypothetical protein
MITEAAVRNLFQGAAELPAGLDLTGFIATANAVASATFGQSKYNLADAYKDSITLYLAGHFTALTYERGGLIRDRMGDGDQSWSDSMDAKGLRLTRFGQQAVMLDTTGELAALDSAKKGRAEFRVV